MAVYRIKDWNKFKRLAQELFPQTVFYIVQPHPLRRPSLGIRITFYHEKNMYLFIDYADNGFLHKTRIPISNYKDEVKAHIRDEDIREVLLKQLGKIDISTLPPFMY